jgi:uncharacterized protein (DUF1778 family)
MSNVREISTNNKAANKSRKRLSSKRLDIRIEEQQKELIERAAAITGQTVSNFAISNLLEKAMEVIESYERIMLSNQARDKFLAALNRPAKELPELSKALALHSQIVVSGND